MGTREGVVRCVWDAAANAAVNAADNDGVKKAGKRCTKKLSSASLVHEATNTSQR